MNNLDITNNTDFLVSKGRLQKSRTKIRAVTQHLKVIKVKMKCSAAFYAGYLQCSVRSHFKYSGVKQSKVHWTLPSMFHRPVGVEGCGVGRVRVSGTVDRVLLTWDCTEHDIYYLVYIQDTVTSCSTQTVSTQHCCVSTQLLAPTRLYRIWVLAGNHLVADTTEVLVGKAAYNAANLRHCDVTTPSRDVTNCVTVWEGDMRLPQSPQSRVLQAIAWWLGLSVVCLVVYFVGRRWRKKRDVTTIMDIREEESIGTENDIIILHITRERGDVT